MKIDKVIFSVSEGPLYSSYWNTQSKLYKVGLGIEPVCLLLGKKSNTDMTEEYGKIIEHQIDEDLPYSIQLTWCKFDYTRTEPETTWIIGDMDLLPLQKAHFTSKIAHIPADDYAHLNVDGVSAPRLGIRGGFVKYGSELHGIAGGYIGTDLPGHYHVAKGKLFEKLYFPNQTLRQTLEHIVYSDGYGMGVTNKYPKELQQTQRFYYYWLAEENYTSKRLYDAIKANQVNFHGVRYHNELERVWIWNKEQNDYQYDVSHAKRKQYVDIHCCQVRPFAPQGDALLRLIDHTGILK